MGGFHHVELWVPDLEASRESWGWLLGELGWTPYQDWKGGCSWRFGDAYLVMECSVAMTDCGHNRLRPGLNHLAFHAEDTATVDRLVEEAPAHGWELLYPERHPYAGGPEHYAAYIADRHGFEAELVAGTGLDPS
ncbi:MAG TPA: VOC family protein [Phytomonospora sp.]